MLSSAYQHELTLEALESLNKQILRARRPLFAAMLHPLKSDRPRDLLFLSSRIRPKCRRPSRL